ncbi:MAG: RNA-directed DNA polymerase [Geodermatophilaceae bacterium]
MRFERGLLAEEEVRAAVDAELDRPVRLLPPSSVNQALLLRRKEVAAWANDRLQGEFVPTPEETVAASKPGHGVRPVAVWDLPSRLAYSALTARLRPVLPAVGRGRTQWRAFQRAPLEHPGKYVVASDIAACYQYIDHGLLTEELLVQTGEHAVVETVTALLRETGGRAYGLPQQSDASDVLAEAFLARLERALIRRGLLVARYSDDFRFSCATWSEATRAIEVLAEESRLLGLTANDMKTITWGRKKYEDHLNEADQLRQEIADEAKIDLTQVDVHPYDDTIVEQAPDQEDVDLLGSVRLLERWASMVRRGNVAASRRAEHRAVLELLPWALGTLGAHPDSPADVLGVCTKVLRFERTLTPAVVAYLATRNDDAAVLMAFDRLLRARAYLNGWQTWWLQQPLARLDGFATGQGAKTRLRWERNALTSAEHTPVLHAHAALSLARHGVIKEDELLPIYSRSSATVRPVLAAAVALLKPSAPVRKAVTSDSALCLWSYEWAESHA